MGNFQEWITVKTYNMSHEAMVLQSLLESEGIECFIKDNLSVQVEPFYSNSIGGAKLQVKEQDYQRAVNLLLERVSQTFRF